MKVAKEIPQEIRFDNIRWLVLFLNTLCQLGGFISINFPTYFELQLKQWLDMDDVKYNLLFSIMSFPNIILPIIMGFLTTVFGSRKILFVSVFLVFFGHSLCTLGVYLREYYWLMPGRMFVGIGHTNIAQPRQVITTKWFEDQELTVALSSFILVGRIGMSLAAVYFSLYQNQPQDQLWIPLFVVSLICFSVLASTQWLVTLDQKLDEQKEEIQLMLIDQGDNNEKDKREKKQKDQNESITRGFMAPVVGGFIDKYGHRAQIWLASCLLPIMGFGVQIFVGECYFWSSWSCQFAAIFPLVMIGLFYAVLPQVKWPSLSIILEKQWLGTFVGLAMSFLNFIQFAFASFVGYIIQSDNGAFKFSWLMLGIGLFHLVGAIWIWKLDKATGGKLEKVYEKRVGGH